MFEQVYMSLLNVVTIHAFTTQTLFYRCYDMRISLNNYEAASSDNPVVEAFISTLHMLTPRVVSFSPKASDNSWTVALIRHKEIKTYMYKPPQFVVSVSTVRQFEVEINTTVTVSIDSKESHAEIEVIYVFCYL